MTAPRIRAGDADRQQSVDRLARHFTDGRMDSTEYDQRVRRAYAAVYLDELPALFSDLPAEPTTLDDYQKAWRRTGWSTAAPSPGTGVACGRFEGCAAAAVFGSLAVVLLWIMLVTHGLFLSRPADLDRLVRVDRRATTPPPPRPTLVKPAAAQRHTVQV